MRLFGHLFAAVAAPIGLLASLGLGPAGCTADVRAIDLDGRAYDYVAVIALDAAQKPVRVSEVAGVAEGRFTFGHAVIEALQDGESDFALLGFRRADLAAVFPAFDVAREPRLHVRVEAPHALPVANEGSRANDVVIDSALLPGSEVLHVNASGALEETAARDAIARELTLELPVDHHQCGTDNDPFVAFARDERALASINEQIGGNVNILRVEPVSETRVLVMTGYHIYDLSVGEVFEPLSAGLGRRGNDFRLADYALHPGTMEQEAFTDFALDDTRGGDGAMLLTAVNGASAPEGVNGVVGRIWELAVYDDGLELVRTATITDDLRGVDVAPDGTRALAGIAGEINLLRRGAPFEEMVPLPDLPLLPGHQIFEARIAWTGDERHPLIAGSASTVHVFDASANSWSTEVIELSALKSGVIRDPNDRFMIFDAFASVPEEHELWGAGSAAGIFRKRDGGPWTRVDLLPPPDYSPCARGELKYPRTLFSDRIDDMVVSGDHIYFTIRGCTAIVEVRRSDLCTRLIPAGGSEPGASLMSDLQALGLRNGRLILGGERGLVYTRSLF